MSVETEVLEEVENTSTTETIQTVVNGTAADGAQWKEVADVFSYTASGLGFYMPRDCAVGNLISMMVPMPAYLRCYDHDEEFYHVWGLIQYCHSATHDDLPAFQVGVAFIGKVPPPSYAANPLQNYRISGMNELGLWSVTEADSRFVQRKELRYWEKVNFYLALIDDRRETIGGERTATENISKSGAAVVTTLELNVGDRIKLINTEFDFSSLAVVCNSRELEDGRYRISLEFVNHTFPVHRLKTTGRVVEA
jgi:hypothetical protein